MKIAELEDKLLAVVEGNKKPEPSIDEQLAETLNAADSGAEA